MSMERKNLLKGAGTTCKSCKDHNKRKCNLLQLLKDADVYYIGRCNRDTETGVELTLPEENKPIT